MISLRSLIACSLIPYISGSLLTCIHNTLGVSSDIAWCLVISSHSLITYWLIHYKQGSLLTWDDDGGKYDGMTYWEQVGRVYLSTQTLSTYIPTPNENMRTTACPIGSRWVVCMCKHIDRCMYMHTFIHTSNNNMHTTA